MVSSRKQHAIALVLTISLCAHFVIAQESEVQQYAEAGQRALASGNYPEAERAYEKLQQLEPGVAEVHANLGLIYFQEGKYGEAIAPLQRALKLKPSLTKSDAILAMSLSEVGRYKEALPGLEKCFRGPTDPEMKRLCGLHSERVYTGLRQDNKAVRVAIEMDRLYPDDPEVLYENGKIFGNFAFLSMQKLAQVAPNSVWRHQTEAEAHESQGSYDAAIAEYRRVLEIDPRRPGIHYRLGRSLLGRSQATTSAEDASAAAKEFEEELALDPLNANSAYELGEIHRSAGDFENAEKDFELAVKNYPDFEEAHLGLAAVLTSLQKPDLALSHLQKAISLDRENEVAWYRLSQVEGMLGNSAEQQKALAEFQRLRAKKRNEQEAEKKIYSPDEVTKQTIDAGSPK